MKRIQTALACVLLGGALYAAESAYEVFQKGLGRERADGDPRGAIAFYQRVVKEFSASRKLAAEALFRIGECQRVIGDVDASKSYERVVRDFPDQREIAAQARERLDSLSPAHGKAGLAARRLLTGEGVDDQVTVSRDAKSVAVVDSSRDLALRDVATGAITRLGMKKVGVHEGGRWPLLSPDQKQIAFEWWNEEGQTMRVAAAQAGSAARVLVRNPEILQFVPSAWSLDGREILTALWRRDLTWQLAWVSVMDGSVRTLKSLDWRSPENVSLSPDGKYIVYDSLEKPNGVDRDIYVLAANGGGEWPMMVGRGNDRGPVWSPDGRQIIFTSDRSGAAGLYSVAVDSGRPKGQPALLKSDVGRIYPRGFAAGGSLYYVQALGNANVHKAELDLTTGKLRSPGARLSDTWIGRNYSPSLSPDGKRVAYLSMRNPVRYGTGEPAIIVKSLGGSAEKEFVPGLPIVGNPVWYSGGHRLMLASLDPRAGFALHSLDLESGALTVVGHLDPGFFPVGFGLSDDGETMYTPFAPIGASSATIEAVKLSTMERKTLMRLNSPAAGAMAISPDQKTIALYLTTVLEGKATSKIVLVPADGTAEKLLFEHPQPSGQALHGAVTWSADGRYVYFSRGGGADGPELWRIPAAGGSAEATGLRAPMLRGLSVGPNGEVTFTAGTPETFELWAMDNLLPAGGASQ